MSVPVKDRSRGHKERTDGQSHTRVKSALVKLSVLRHQLSAYGLGIAHRDPYVVGVNENHTQLCPSPEWAEHIQDDVLPSLVNIASLGDCMLELGPGPGAATQWLHHRVRRLIAVEADESAATLLAERFAGTNVEVVTGDASHLDFASDTFDSVGSF